MSIPRLLRVVLAVCTSDGGDPLSSRRRHGARAIRQRKSRAREAAQRQDMRRPATSRRFGGDANRIYFRGERRVRYSGAIDGAGQLLQRGARQPATFPMRKNTSRRISTSDTIASNELTPEITELGTDLSP